MPKLPRLHHILRIDSDSKRMHSWRVQVQRRGEIAMLHFNDRQYGGKRKALQAAILSRDALLEKMEDDRYALWRRNCKRRNNTSGIVGVGCYVSREEIDGKSVERISWQAFWEGADGKRHSRKFSVKKYGAVKAKALACAARKQALAALTPPSRRK